MGRKAIISLLLAALLAGFFYTSPSVDVSAQESQEIIDFGDELKTDQERLFATYSLLEQIRLEHNKVGAIAGSDWQKYSGKWNQYVPIYRSKVKPILHEQNLLKAKIRKARFTDAEWRRLNIEDLKQAEHELYGDKSSLLRLSTRATSPQIAELKNISLDTLASVESIDPTEDLTTYSIVPDPLVYTTVIAARATFTILPRNVDELVYDDKGVAHFNADFEHLLDCYLTNGGTGTANGLVMVWALANVVDDRAGIVGASGDELSVNFKFKSDDPDVFWIELAEIDGGSYSTDDVVISSNTQYWLTVERDEAVGDHGTLYCYVYDDAPRTSQIAGSPMSVTLNTSKKDFRYIYAIQSHNSGNADYILSGWMQNLDLQEVLAPTVVTNAASSIEETTATLSGNITATGGENCTDRGFQWDVDSGVPYADNWTEAGNFGVSQFTHGIAGLTKGELYYYRAGANNTAGWGWGAEVTFLTKPDEPNTLVATGLSGQINLTWNKGTGADNTTITAKQGSYPANRADGTVIYDNTGTSVSHTGLGYSEHWYYRAWSWCTEGGKVQYSDTYAQATATTSGVPIPPSEMLPEAIPPAVGIGHLAFFIPLVLFSVPAFWRCSGLLFLLAAASSLMMGFYWYVIFTTNLGLSMGLMLIAYGLICLVFALGCLFKRRRTSEE